MKRILRLTGLITVAIVLFYVGVMASCLFGIFILPKFTPSQERLERYLGVVLPSDATDIQIRIDEGFQDDLFFVRFTVPQTSYDALIAQLCNEPGQTVDAETKPNLGIGGVTYPDWFYTDQNTIDLSGRCGPAVIFADQQDSGEVILYIIAF